MGERRDARVFGVFEGHPSHGNMTGEERLETWASLRAALECHERRVLGERVDIMPVRFVDGGPRVTLDGYGESVEDLSIEERATTTLVRSVYDERTHSWSVDTEDVVAVVTMDDSGVHAMIKF